jgi:hypothetical protein
VDDPKLCVLIHLMTQMEPIEPILESPLVRPLAKQLNAATDLLTEVGSAKTAMEGMLLSNLERNGMSAYEFENVCPRVKSTLENDENISNIGVL